MRRAGLIAAQLIGKPELAKLGRRSGELGSSIRPESPANLRGHFPLRRQGYPHALADAKTIKPAFDPAPFIGDVGEFDRDLGSILAMNHGLGDNRSPVFAAYPAVNAI